MPEETTCEAVASILVIGWAGVVGVSPAGAVPLTAAAAAEPALVGAADSCRVPQEPHSGQRPNHLGEA